MDKSCEGASSQNLSSICFMKGWTSPDTGVTNSSWAVCGQHSETVLHNTLKCSPRVCVCTHMHVCVFVWRLPTWVHSSVTFYLNFEAGSLTESEVHPLALLAGSLKSFVDPPVFMPPHPTLALGLQICVPSPHFCWRSTCGSLGQCGRH